MALNLVSLHGVKGKVLLKILKSSYVMSSIIASV